MWVEAGAMAAEKWPGSQLSREVEVEDLSSQYDPNFHRQMGVEADVVLRVGMMLMGAGTSGYRVLRGMKRSARALGFDYLDANVGLTQITCTFHRGDSFRTVIARTHSPAVDASRIEALEDLTHNHLYSGITAEELAGMLDSIESDVKKRWSVWVLSTAAAVACAAFAYLNFFPVQAVGLVALAAFVGQFVRYEVLHQHVHQIGGIIAGGAAASITFFILIELLGFAGVVEPSELSSGYVAAVLFLIPGFPLFSALIDIARFDFDAGIARLGYAFTVIFTATFTVSMVSWLTDLSPDPPVPAPDTRWYLLASVASFFGIAGFAFLFNSSRRMVLVAASVGTVANAVRLGLLELGTTIYFAAFIGGLIIGLLGAVASQKARLPRITTTVPAAVIMIPGVTMFRAVYYLNDGQMDQAVANVATGLMVVGAIGAGMVFARLLTDRDWALGRLIDFDKEIPRKKPA